MDTTARRHETKGLLPSSPSRMTYPRVALEKKLLGVNAVASHVSSMAMPPPIFDCPTDEQDCDIEHDLEHDIDSAAVDVDHHKDDDDSTTSDVGDDRGVNQYKMTPQTMSQMIYNNRDHAVEDYKRERRNSVSRSPKADRQKRGQHMNLYDYHVSQMQGQEQEIDTESGDEGLGVLGLFESTKNWLHEQRLKRQQENLQRAVEEQRRILLEETMRARRLELSRAKFNPFERSLDDNPAFQSITQQHNHHLNMCVGPGCVNTVDQEADDDYIVEPNDYDSSNNRPNEVNCDEENEYGIGENREEDSIHDYNTAAESEHTELWSCSGGKYTPTDEDVFRIGTPCGTHAGGMAVQLEFVEPSQKSVKEEVFNIKVEEEEECTVPFLLDRNMMETIGRDALPPSVAFSKWKRIYCLERDGDSFEGAFLRKIKNHIRTLLIIQTTKGELFGAFSNSPWVGQTSGAQFYGSAQASLFSIDKDTQEVSVFNWTGRNRYIQVCDVANKMLAMGGGGEEGEFGVCVEDDFRRGSTGPCETFANRQLCSQNQFEIMNVECWGFVSGFM